MIFTIETRSFSINDSDVSKCKQINQIKDEKQSIDENQRTDIQKIKEQSPIDRLFDRIFSRFLKEKTVFWRSVKTVFIRHFDK